MAKAKVPPKKRSAKAVQSIKKTSGVPSLRSQYVTTMTFVFFLLSLLFLAIVFVKYY